MRCMNFYLKNTAFLCKNTHKYFTSSSAAESGHITAGCAPWAAMPAEPCRQDGRLVKASSSSHWGLEWTHTVLLAQKGNKC